MKSTSQVVFCTHDSPESIGGPFSWLSRLLPGLRQMGIDSRVLALTHFGGTGLAVESLRNDGFEVVAVDCPERTEDAVRWILEQIGDTTPEVFVANFVVPALFASRWLRDSGCRTVGVLHSDDDYYRAVQQEFVLKRSSFRLTDVVTVSESLQSEVLGQCSDQEISTTYIPYGVPIPRVNERCSEQPLKIAYVGRLVEQQKRISLVAESLVAACEQVPGTQAVIFGDGPDRAIVQSILQKQICGFPVRAVGAIRQQDVQRHLSGFDVITLLSDYEGLPISLLEAMACGCVPICREMNSGIPQLVRHGKTGLIVSDKKSEFVDTVRLLADNRALVRQLGDAARDVVQKGFSEERSVHMWWRFLNKCLSESRVSGRPFRVPRRVRLPPARDELEGAGSRTRKGSTLQRRLRWLRIKLGAVRRKLF